MMPDFIGIMFYIYFIHLFLTTQILFCQSYRYTQGAICWGGWEGSSIGKLNVSCCLHYRWMFNCSKCRPIGPTINLKKIIRPVDCLFFPWWKKKHPPTSGFYPGYTCVPTLNWPTLASPSECINESEVHWLLCVRWRSTIGCYCAGVLRLI